jgi:hypothetical protein
MRITLSGAMRARDVSRPRDEQLAAAAERDARATRTGRPGRAVAPPGAGSAEPADAPPARPGDANEAGQPQAAQASHAVQDAAGEADGAGRSAVNGPADPDPAGDDMPSPTRRRRRRGR